VQDTEDDVIPQPNNKKPACPIEAVEHKHAASNRENPGEMDDPMCPELGSALSVCCINVWQQASKECDAAERYEYPTEDRN